MSSRNFVLGTAAAGVTLVALIQRYRLWWLRNKSDNCRNVVSKPAAITCFTDTEFDVLVAVLDAFFPSLTDDDVTRLVSETSLPMDVTSIDPTVLSRSAPLLKSGAINRGSYVMASDVLQNCTNKADQVQLSGLLSALSTTVGCLAITGFPAPFQELGQKNREKALLRLRDSFLPDLRVAFQTLKRLACFSFFSTLRPDVR
jgi:hypothetical protein